METAYGAERTRAIDLLNGDPDVSPADARFCIEKSDRVIVHESAARETVGCGAFRRWGAERDRADAYLYVRPDARTAGVGKTLLKALTDTPERRALRFVSTRVETNHAQSVAFFEKAGFTPWYTERILRHAGERPPVSELAFSNYRCEDFAAYVDAIRRSFYTLRSANDFEPYDCCEPTEAKKNELAQKKDRIYVLRDGDGIAASVTVEPGAIEDVFVAPAYQGRGIGKQMLRFALNKAIDGGAAQIELSAIEWNQRALRLYESVGFHVAKTIHFLRLFS